MGLSADAELIFGIPIEAYDEHYEPTQFWDEENDDWVDLAAKLAVLDGAVDPWPDVPEEVNHGPYGAFEKWEAANPEWVARLDAWYEAKHQAESHLAIQIEHYGHCDDPDGRRAILRAKRVEMHSGDCWDAKRLDSDALYVSDKALSKANDSARTLDLDVNFYGDAGWYLVASYG